MIERFALARTWTDDDLREAVVASHNMKECLTRLGLTAGPGNRGTVKKYINKLSLDVSHWHGQSYSELGSGSRGYPIEEILVEGSTYKTCHLRDRLVKAGLKDLVCEGCGLNQWMGQPIPIEVDHVNGINNDHRIENLRFLCPNCHALTPTWRGRKNKAL